MKPDQLRSRFREIIARELPNPGAGKTALRHECLMEVGREDLSLARLAEAHWDAVAILAEANRRPEAGAAYAVWASEISGHPLKVDLQTNPMRLSGVKHFCSGVGFVDRALITAGDGLLLDVELRGNAGGVTYDDTNWVTTAFRETRTSTAVFHDFEATTDKIIGEDGWYTARPGFWHGACGPAACWAGGASGLLDYALQQKREDPHSLAHLGAIYAAIWAMKSYLNAAGHQIDESFSDPKAARIRALALRHLVENSCTDVLRRLPRAYGPHPLAMQEDIAKRYIELDLYLRQSHAERDLESLGREVRG